MAVDSKYKGNRTLKDAGQKPQNAEDKEYVEMIQQQTTFEAAAEGGDFRYSENYQNFDPSKKDYPDLEYTYPPFNPPPFDPWPPGPVPPKDDPPGGDITNEFGCTDPTFCWCPDEEKCGMVTCTQEAVAAAPVDPASGASAYCYHNKLCITGAETTPSDLSIEITMQSRNKLPGGGEVRTQARDVVIVKKCAQEKCCGCNESKISYTTNQMAGGETQNLSATKVKDACKDKVKLTWTANYGSFSPSTGRDVVYTAPPQNSTCDKSADITLYCDGKVIDTLHISITVTGAGAAYFINECNKEYACEPSGLGGGICTSGQVRQNVYNCSGDLIRSLVCYCCYGFVGDECVTPENCKSISAHCTQCYYLRGITDASCAGMAVQLTTTGGVPHMCVNQAPAPPPYDFVESYGPGTLGTIVDVRTQEMKDLGCCPAALS